MADRWSITVKKRLIDRNMTRRQLAEQIGVNYTVVCAVINGSTNRTAVREKINQVLHIEEAHRERR